MTPKEAIARRRALEKNLKFYPMSEPCQRGHLGLRYANSRHCVECQKINTVVSKERRAMIPVRSRPLIKAVGL